MEGLQLEMVARELHADSERRIARSGSRRRRHRKIHLGWILAGFTMRLRGHT